MKLLLKILQIYLPTHFKKKNLKKIFNDTARAFECEVPPLEGLSFDDWVRKYALFTKREAEESLQQGHDMQAIRNHLHQSAYQLGQRLRKKFHITTMEEAMTMSKILYRALGIDFQGNRRGEVTISQCYFSRFFSNQICKVISSLDEGVIAGLSGGGKLIFSQRITEGKDCCKASVVVRET